MTPVNNNDIIMRFVPLWGNWVPDAVLGEGGYGKVYRAHRIDDPKYVSAVKHVRIPRSDSERAEAARMGLHGDSARSYFDDMSRRIISEIELMYALRGEANIVAYEDHLIYRTEEPFSVDIFIRMELLTPLADYIGEHPFPPSEVRRLGLDICSALNACAAYNIIHRDIKEGNVFVNNRGAFKLGDFGIARELSGSSSGMSMRGTPMYIAPEVYLGRKYDATVDIYSLGILLYKLLNGGRYPFLPPTPYPISTADTDAAFQLRMDGRTPSAPSSGDPALISAVMCAISFDPRQRFYSAAQMAAALSPSFPPDVMLPAAPVTPAGPYSEYSRIPSGETRWDYPAAPVTPDIPAAPAAPCGNHPGVQSGDSGRKFPVIPAVLGALAFVSVLALLIVLLTGNKANDGRKGFGVFALFAAPTPAQSLAPTAKPAEPTPEPTPEPTETPPELQSVIFSDAKFESLIRQLLARPSGDILRGELEGITSLTILGERCMYAHYDYFDLSGQVFDDGSYIYSDSVKYPRGSLSDISDLAYFPNLTELNISCTEIDDISVLHQLPNIKTLRLTSNIYLSDISPIASLSKLKGDLQLFMNDIYDISPLAQCFNLTRLTVSSNRVSDLSPISGLTGLVYLNMYRNDITSVYPLGGLVNLQNLRINVNRISDISPLASLVNLRELRMDDNSIYDISALRNLAQLEVLYMQKNNVSDISALSFLPALRTVNVKDNPIYDYSPLANIGDAQY